MENRIEYKNFGGSVKDVDTQKNIVTGYFAAFGNIDSDRDMIQKGAFAKTIAERGPASANDIFHLKQHNWLHVLGKPTLLEEDSKGLRFETPFADTHEAKDVVKLYQAGIYKEHSIGYRTIKGTPVKDNTIEGGEYRLMQELKLYEGSTVAMGANRETPFTGLKSGTNEWLNTIITDMDTCCTILKQRDLTDETYKRAERRLEQIKTELSTFDFKPKSLEEEVPEVVDLTDLKQAIQKLKTTTNGK